MQDYQYVQAGGDALFVVAVIVAMIIKQIVKISKPQMIDDEDSDSEITSGGNTKRSYKNTQDELQTFLQNLASGTAVQKAATSSVPHRPPPIKRDVVKATPAQKAATTVPHRPAPTVARTPEPIPLAHKGTLGQEFLTEHAYDQERHHEVCVGKSLHEIRVDIGADLINVDGIRKGIVLSEILGAPIALKKAQHGIIF